MLFQVSENLFSLYDIGMVMDIPSHEVKLRTQMFIPVQACHEDT